MADFNKKQKKHMKELAALAYEKEMNSALHALSREFEKWKNSEIGPLELNDKVHQHHNYKAKELYKIYDMGIPELAVARAIARGIINEEEVKENCLQFLERMVEMFKENNNMEQ